MRELQSEMVGDRRVRLLADENGRCAVTIETWEREGWADISLQSDRDLTLHTASLCYRLRLTEQQARAIVWGES